MSFSSRICLFALAAMWLSASCFAQRVGAAGIRSSGGYSPAPTNQRFVCNVGYSVEECRKQSAIVRWTVVRYHAQDLGSWTWILVRAEDWKDLMRRLQLNPDSPAFTAVDARETFLEESLISPRPQRARELMLYFRVPTDHLLDLAVTHELGHAACNGGTEYLAEQYAAHLRSGLPTSCAEAMMLYP
jgi:hypothetical protein